MSWFLKITGDDECVTTQKGKFLQFLKSVSFVESASAPTAAASTAPTGSNGSGSIWTIPPGWRSVPPSQFLLAEYSIPGANGAKAEGNVAAMGGSGGGPLPNI